MNDIAIIGMSGRFPGAKNLSEFWSNIRDGKESIKNFTNDELRSAGISEELIADPNYIKAHAIIDEVDMFDANFFGYNPKEAEILDPQQRLFLEYAKLAIDDAAYNPENFDGLIGVYAGTGGFNSYLFHNLINNKKLIELFGTYQIFLGNEKDFLSTRASYKLNLKGPSVTVQTACSTSLMAVHMACHSLQSYQTDMALAGGVRVSIPQVTGYQYSEGFILSSDGHVRTFDAGASGTVPGEGIGLVVLKRLEDAINDRDNIHAIIKASASNNDGSLKAGYTAPSVEGQAEVIATAQAIAEVDPETIGYIEAHGTGTLVGDPIEITALNEAFKLKTNKKGFCAIGSVKPNIGHTDIASGVAGLIKAVLALKNKTIPPSINYTTPNPSIDFDNTPLYVPTEAKKWESKTPRRAGVSAFGLGGTNVHVIVEENNIEYAPKESKRSSHLIAYSAKSNDGLDAYSEILYNYLQENNSINIADLAYSLKVGRQHYSHRRMFVAENFSDISELLKNINPERVFTQKTSGNDYSVVFMFAGGGAQYPNMALELYNGEEYFKRSVDECLNILLNDHNLDVRKILFPSAEEVEDAKSEIQKPSVALPILFTISYSLSKQFIKWGIKPSAMIGHSMGEYVAACLSGVFSVEDALKLVLIRGRLFETLPEGAMLSVSLDPSKLTELMGDKLSIAAINGPSLSVASGPVKEIEELQSRLEQKEIDCRRIKISVAAHSSMLVPILEKFRSAFNDIQFGNLSIPFVSNLSGTWIKPEEAENPDYWVKHLAKTVDFSGGLKELMKEQNRILLEVGPGRTLSTLAKQHPDRHPGQPIFSSLRHPQEETNDYDFLNNMLGRLWLTGLEINWNAFYENEERYRLSLPGYPFQRKRYWIEPASSTLAENSLSFKKQKSLDDWFYIPSWKRALSPKYNKLDGKKSRIIVFQNDFSYGNELVKSLDQDVVKVKKGTGFSSSPDGFVIDPTNPDHYLNLFQELDQEDIDSLRIIHLWSYKSNSDISEEERINNSFYSLLYLSQAIAQTIENKEINISVVTDDLFKIESGDGVDPFKALLLGPIKVIPLELNNINCKVIDVDLSLKDNLKNTEQIAAEILNPTNEPVIAYRGNKKLIETYEQVSITESTGRNTLLKENGAYIITGGLGGVGLAIAKKIAQTVKANLILINRSEFPEKKEWEKLLENNNTPGSIRQKIEKVNEIMTLGSECLIMPVNITEENSVKKMVEDVKKRFPKIDGVIHSAGVLNDGIIQLKNKEAVESVFKPKIYGTLNLNKYLGNEGIDFLVLCSALSTATGSLAQIDYVSANAFLNAFADNISDKIKTISINWGTWKDVGLAAATISRDPQSKSEKGRYNKLTEHPLVEFELSDNSQDRIFKTEFSKNKFWILDEHKIKGKGNILPGTSYLEIIRAAAEHIFNDGKIELENVQFLYPFGLDNNENKDLFIRFHTEPASTEFTIYSSSEHVKGFIKPVSSYKGKEINIEEIINSESFEEIDPGIINQVENLELGPRWNNLKKLFIGKKNALGILEIPDEYKTDLSEYKLHPALLDVATGCAMPLTGNFKKDNSLLIALSYDSIKFLNEFTSKIFSYVEYRNDLSDEKILTFDITILNEDQRVAAEISGFSLKKINEAELSTFTFNGKEKRSTDMEFQRPSLANSLLDAAVREGMTSEEGAEAFSRAISIDSITNVLVSPIKYEALKFKVDEMKSDQLESEDEEIIEEGEKSSDHSRPNLPTTYVAAESDLEEKILGIWEQILGITGIGVYDDFFELGGHSLMFTQVISRLKKLTPVTISLKDLFEKPTIRGIADKINEKSKDKTSTDVPKLKKISREKFSSAKS